MIDLHSHLVPGVDDGAATLAEALEAVAEMRRDGILTVVTTPHLNLSLLRRPDSFARYMDRMDAGWAALTTAAATRFPGIDLRRGVELALDDLPMALTDDRLFLAGTRFVLIEFPRLHIPPNSEYAVRALRSNGVFPLFAHPERYDNLGADLRPVRIWKDVGASVQVNSGSLIGRYGRQAQRNAEAMIAGGLVDCLSSDYHARGRCTMQSAARLLTARGLERQAVALTETNAAKILSGTLPDDVTAGSPSGRWSLGAVIRRLLGR